MSMKPLYLNDDLEKDNKYVRLNEETKKSIIDLREKGYCILDLTIEKNVLNMIIDDCKSKYQDANDSRIPNAFLFSENVKHLALDEQIINFLRNAYGREPIPFQTLNFNKGTEQATHSDSIHFNTFPYGFMCGAWVALEEIDNNNGPLHYYPGSHKLPFFGMDEFSIHGSAVSSTYQYYDEYVKGLRNLIERLGLKKESVKMSKGQCLIWSANLLHGGDPILDKNSSRHSQVTHYFFEDCLYYTPLLSSPFKSEYHVRRPINIFEGKPISKKDMKRFAQNAGIKISKIKKKKWGIF